MNISKSLVSSALVALTVLLGSPARADNLVSIGITPATGVVTLTPRWTIGGNLAGFHHMAQDLSLGGGANQFYSITSNGIPAGGDIAAFTRYIAASGAATNHNDIGSKLTPSSYLALTSADPDVGYGPVNFYFIHRKSTGDYFSVIVPSSGVASAVTDLKPMSGPGGPATLGATGYFGLTFSAANLGDGLNNFYYLRRDPVSGSTKFGYLVPALLGTSADKFDLGAGGHNALAYTSTDVGFGVSQMYYERLDPVTGFTILGTLHPVTGRAADIANLGSVYTTLTFVPGDVGFGSGRFYATGAVNPTWQSVSFAALNDRAISAGAFTVAPSASSALPIVLTVVGSSTGAASISGPVGGVFTVTPTAPGVIVLQATQSGQAGLYASNMLRQSFTATGTATLAITTQPTAQSSAVGGTSSLTVAASGTTALSYQWRKAGTNITGNASATTSTLTLTNVQASDAATYDVVVSNASGTITSNPITLAVIGVPAITPVLTSPNTATATAGGSFVSYQIAATGAPTGYTATGLPTGLTLNTLSGTISGTPSTAGIYPVTVTVSNSTATTTGTVTFTVAAAPAPLASRIVNFSARAISGPGDQSLIMGFVVSGNNKNLLVRGIGPGLAAYGVTTVLADPLLTLYNGPTAVATNDDWSVSSTGQNQISAVSVVASRVGAFALPAGSKDSSLLFTVDNGAHTTGLLRPNSGTGVALTEIYDTDSVGTSRLVNVSARMNVLPGEGTLIAGFIIAGNTAKTVLIRGVGPTLANFGVTGVLADPQIAVSSGGTLIASNDNWDAVATSGGAISTASVQFGAFALAAGSKDAALLLTLQPGLYSVQVSGVANTTGVALIEIYDAQLP